MNTLMAGTGNAGRSRYTAAGYAYDENAAQERELHIGRDQAGFKRELMRDNNRVGYSAPELDDDGIPFSFFVEEARREEERERAKKERERSARMEAEEEKLSFIEYLRRTVRRSRRERRAMVACCVLAMVSVTLFAFYLQGVIDGVRKRDLIEGYENGAKTYMAEIEETSRKIEAAQNGELIRNRAQNELGMLRGERVATQTIYIQTYNLTTAEPAEQYAQEESGLLDWLLSVAAIFDFKS